MLVHDAARALTPSAVFDAVVETVRASAAGVLPMLPVVDTIKRIDHAGIVHETVDRAELAAVQTPQGFPREVLVAALAAASANDIAEATDDAALVSASGHPVQTMGGDPLAFKITTPDDLRRAHLLLASDVSAASVTPAASAAPRIGTGMDVHAFDDTSPLWLAGLHWPGERGLSGHSDGDAAVHAICDALLAAAGLGDIGGIFGTADPRLTDAHGEVFLNETLRLLTEADSGSETSRCRSSATAQNWLRVAPKLRRCSLVCCTPRSLFRRRRPTRSASPAAARASLHWRRRFCSRFRPRPLS